MNFLRLAAIACVVVTSLCAQPARLSNISTRGPVGTDAANMFGGFVIRGGPKTVLVRAIGPTLESFGVPRSLANPTVTIFNDQNVAVATNDDWKAADAATFSQVGAFPLPDKSKDSVIVTTLQPGSYTAQIAGLGSANTGVGLLEVYDVSGSGQLVNIATRLPVGTGTEAAFAGFVVAPGSGTRKLLVRGVGPALAGFGLTGTLPDPKLTILDANNAEVAVATPNGAASVLTTAAAAAGAFPITADDTAVIINVAPGTYTAQLSGNSGTTSGIGIVEVYDVTNAAGLPPAYGQSQQLFFTNLRSGTAGSTASGYGTILYDPNTASATVSVSFSNLSSTQSGAHLVLGAAGGNGTFVYDLPRGQVSGAYWAITPKGPYSVNDIVAALLTGNLSVQIDTANFPAGEIRAALAPTRGSIAFTPPAAPPALAASALTSPSQTDAARFLTQATFGPTMATIAALQARGIPGWIDDQMALPMTSTITTLRATKAANPTPLNPSPVTQKFVPVQDWVAHWWKVSVNAPDQLRQRVAFALSELLVVGEDGSDQTAGYSEMKGNYYDILLRGAFGNYRQLLEDVSTCPTMACWLTYMSNQPADPVAGTAPDENYAREIQQLFTIGLVQLQPDGSLMLDASAQPIPTYDQSAVSETARVFTGWYYNVLPLTTTDATAFRKRRPPDVGWNVISDASPFFQPLVNYPAFHDKGLKRVVSLDQVPLDQARRSLIPANQTGLEDLRSFLDILFAHPNLGPFVSRHLIQRLVTVNPSPGYVYRVAQVFANDGSGTRGNLGAVVRAILTDYEARSPAVIGNLGYGKLKEPLIRMTTLFRAAKFSSPNGEWLDSYYLNPTGYFPDSALCNPGWFAQSPVMSRTVFNYFSPTYSQPGAMAAAGLVSPEMEIVDSSYAMVFPRVIQSYLFRKISTLPQPSSGASPYVDGDYADFMVNANNPTALIDQLSLIFCQNQMSAATRSTLTTMYQNLAARTDVSALNRVKGLINVVMISPDGATQR